MRARRSTGIFAGVVWKSAAIAAFMNRGTTGNRCITAVIAGGLAAIALTYGLWAAEVVIAAVHGADVWNIEIAGPRADHPLASRLGMALGMAGIPYLLTALIALVVWLVTKKRNAALWTWTATLLISILVLSFGMAGIP